MCLLLDWSSLWSDLDGNSRKIRETLLGGPSCLKNGQKIWISCVAKVKLQIRIKINERKKSEEAKQSVWSDLKNMGLDQQTELKADLFMERHFPAQSVFVKSNQGEEKDFFLHWWSDLKLDSPVYISRSSLSVDVRISDFKLTHSK